MANTGFTGALSAVACILAVSMVVVSVSAQQSFCVSGTSRRNATGHWKLDASITHEDGHTTINEDEDVLWEFDVKFERHLPNNKVVAQISITAPPPTIAAERDAKVITSQVSSPTASKVCEEKCATVALDGPADKANDIKTEEDPTGKYRTINLMAEDESSSAEVSSSASNGEDYVNDAQIKTGVASYWSVLSHHWAASPEMSDEIFPHEEEDDYSTSIEATAAELQKCARSDYTFYPGVGCYKLHLEGQTWQDANRTCVSEGAHLVIINSLQEEKALMDLMRSKITMGAFVFIGINDLDTEGEFQTVFGEPFSSVGYAHWEKDTPNNAAPGEDCGAIKVYGRIDDFYCSAHCESICELPS